MTPMCSRSRLRGRTRSLVEPHGRRSSKIIASGSPRTAARTEVSGMGAIVCFRDPEGNTLGLWENL